MNDFVYLIQSSGEAMNYFFAPIDNIIEKIPIMDFAKEALIDTVHMIPFLLFIFFVIEILEYFFGHKMNEKVKTASKAAPFLGGLFACIPQCGFSIVASSLYSKKLITTGTLIAVFLSTSDEAIPVILAKPDQTPLVLKLLSVKVLIAVTAGYFIDIVFRNYRNKISKEPAKNIFVSSQEEFTMQNNYDNEFGSLTTTTRTIESSEEAECENFCKLNEGCCGHHLNSQKNKIEFIIHPVTHTAKITLFIFLATIAINYLVFRAGGEGNLGGILLQNSILQPILAAFVGLIPNCAASVAITLMYLKGGISFGSLVSGLCTGSGLGLLVLFKENKDIKDTVRIMGILLTVSITIGILIQWLWG